MSSLQCHHIIDLYCVIDDILPAQEPNPLGGRPPTLSDSELITILIWNTLVSKHQTLSDLYQSIQIYHKRDFPRIPKYRGFVNHCHRALPQLVSVLRVLLSDEAPLRLLDSTMLEVCKLKRADTHKVASSIAAFGKNHQGWHYGFKLHASIDHKGRLSGVVITPANVHDAQMMPRILNKHTKVAVGDTLYGARVMGRIIWERYGTIIVAPPHYTQKKKIMTAWQHLLLNFRSKIESVFDYLKEHMHLVSSFPRSPRGYVLHYVRILLAYQIMTLGA